MLGCWNAGMLGTEPEPRGNLKARHGYGLGEGRRAWPGASGQSSGLRSSWRGSYMAFLVVSYPLDPMSAPPARILLAKDLG